MFLNYYSESINFNTYLLSSFENCEPEDVMTELSFTKILTSH